MDVEPQLKYKGMINSKHAVGNFWPLLELWFKLGNTFFSHYSAGGSGIHRPLGGSRDVGADYKSKVSDRVEKCILQELPVRKCSTKCVLFIFQKGKGDVKKKGKLDPYAYIPLKKAQLNRRYEQRLSLWDSVNYSDNELISVSQTLTCLILYVNRKRAKLQGQFKGMVKGAQKGALSGKKLQKKKRKAWGT